MSSALGVATSVSSSALQTAVEKATRTGKMDEPPKAKHVRTCVLATHADNAAQRFLRELFRRPIERKSLVAWKSLVVLHSVLHEGHHKTAEDCYLLFSFFESFKGAWATAGGRAPKLHVGHADPHGMYEPLVRMYIDFMVEKIGFHHLHNEFAGDFSIDKMGGRVALRRTFAKLGKAGTVQLSENMFDLLELITSLERTIFDQRATTDVKASALVPMVTEAYNLYQLQVTIIRDLLDDPGDSVELLPHIIERFYAAYPPLRTFFFDASNVKLVTQMIVCPTLPHDPPSFIIATQRPSAAKRSTPEQVKEASSAKITTASAPTSFSAQLKPASAPVPKPISHNPFAHTNPFANAVPQSTAPKPVQKPVLAPMSGPSLRREPTHERKDSADAFAGLLGGMVDHLKDRSTLAANSRAAAEAQAAREREEAAAAAARREKEMHAQLEAQAAERQRREAQERIEAQALHKAREIAQAEAAEERKQIQARERAAAEERVAKAAAEAEAAARSAGEAKLAQVRAAGEMSAREVDALQRRVVELEAQLAAANERVQGLTAELEASRELESKRQAEIVSVQNRIAELEFTLQSSSANHRVQLTELQERLDLTERQRVELQEERLALKQGTLVAEESALENARAAAEAAASDATRDALRAVLKGGARDAVDDLDDSVALLDLPTNPGNAEANAATLQAHSSALTTTADELLSSARSRASTSDDAKERCNMTMGQLRAANRATTSLLADVKGLSRKIEDENSRAALFDSARAVAEALRRLLVATPSITDEVDALDDAAPVESVVVEDMDSIRSSVHNLRSAAVRAEAVQAGIAQEHQTEDLAASSAGLDMDALAEKELMAAADVISQAAKALLATQQKQKEQASQGDQPEVAAAILQAAMAITNAVAMLVKAASMAQEERVRLGREGDKSGKRLYRADPAWSQGLISAAKAVAACTQTLVTTANDAVEGKVQEESVVAASKGVAAATAQIVAATRARSDPSGKAQQALDKAASSVTSAVSELVAAVRAIATAKHQADAEALSQKAFTSEIDRRVAEMEMQTRILELEKQLEGQRKSLFTFRQHQYKQ